MYSEQISKNTQRPKMNMVCGGSYRVCVAGAGGTCVNYILYKLVHPLIISGRATRNLLEGLPMERGTGDWKSRVE